MIALYLSDDKIKELNKINTRWKKFKLNRIQHKYLSKQGRDFITVLDREKMINNLLSIYLGGEVDEDTICNL